MESFNWYFSTQHQQIRSYLVIFFANQQIFFKTQGYVIYNTYITYDWIFHNNIRSYVSITILNNILNFFMHSFTLIDRQGISII